MASTKGLSAKTRRTFKRLVVDPCSFAPASHRAIVSPWSDRGVLGGLRPPAGWLLVAFMARWSEHRSWLGASGYRT